MSTWKRWLAGVAVSGALVLAVGAAVVAQQTQVPENGQALAARLGLKGDAARKLQPQLDKLAAALREQSRSDTQARQAGTQLHSALAGVLPELSPAQRQQLGSMMAGSGWGYGVRGGGWGMGYGMGRGMHRGMAGRGMGYGMYGAMGRYMSADGMGAYCPFYGSGAANAPAGGDGSSGR